MTAPRLRASTVAEPAAINFTHGTWGTCINGQTFQQEALLTHGSHQYAACFAADGTVSVARRHLPDGAWETMRLPDYRLMPLNDTHNVVSLGICPADGTIHLAFDHHNHPLRIRRSRPGAALDPAAHPWVPELFGPIEDRLEGTAPLEGVCYPAFLATPGGDLQLLYRLGGSGDGDWHLAEYRAGGGWRQVGLLLSRHGTYRGSIRRCAYPNPMRYAADGTLHLTWSWREGIAPGDLSTNHDLLHAWSPDRGRTWLDGAGNALPVGGIAVDTPGILAVPMAFGWGQMNTTTQRMDPRGRLHVVAWANPPDAAGPSLDLDSWIYRHCWRDTDGGWRERRLPFAGRKPQILFDAACTAFLIATDGPRRGYHGSDDGGRLHIACAVEADGWASWVRHEVGPTWYVGEPQVDAVRWERAGILSIYAQEKPGASGASSALRVLDIEPPAP